MSSGMRVLLIDDDASLLKLLSMRLRTQHYEVATADSGKAGLVQVQTFHPNVVIVDLRMDDIDGMSVFRQIHADNPSLPVIVLTAHGSIPHAIEATREGAFGYLTKPFDSRLLLREIAHALRVGGSGEEGDDTGRRHGLITRSARMEEILSQAQRVARSDVSVLIQSESGTGKELLARLLHDQSSRVQHPFMALNCSAVPESLLESELFGHSKGAFTGATRDHPGLFQAASGGTLFLDEIGDMPLGFQAKLLRVLQEKEVRPVGASRSVPIDVRMIAATHQDLRQAVEQGRFREDLYYRLNVVELGLPPLRERPEDIPLLADHFLQQLAQQSGETSKRFAPDAMDQLISAPWPGNVRQLRNVVEQCSVLSHTALIPASLVSHALREQPGEVESLAEARERFERDYLMQVLQITEGNVTQAAQMAKRNRTEFYKLLRRHHLEPEQFRRTSDG